MYFRVIVENMIKLDLRKESEDQIGEESGEQETLS